MVNISYKTKESVIWINVTSFNKIPINAIEINCCGNKMASLPDFNHLINLQIIYCSNNMLKNLPEWETLINLQKIYCDNNRLLILPDWKSLINLTHIYCTNNKLIHLPKWNQLTNLKIIYCFNNKLTHLPEWDYLVNLQFINCSNNKLSYLPEWNQLINLKSIVCVNNQLIHLPISWSRLYNLQYICYSGNPIEYIPPNLLRIINSNGQNIYNDNQNVHNHNIQISLRSSIEYLIKDKPSISLDQMRQEIENECLSFELIMTYCEDKSVHTILNVTFEEVLYSVWCKIRNNINKHEIIKILNIEILDSECKCFTGRLTRLVNCLSGFDNNISITISNNEQMSNISRILYEKHGDNIENYQRELRKEFEERGYSEEDINMWISIE